jgi:replication-associated recombination protein RarA
MRPLFERARPTEFDQVVGQPEAVKRLKAMEARDGLAGQVYWFAGLSGTGKTSFAKIIANKVSGWSIREIPVKQVDEKSLEKWEQSTSMRCIDGSGHALVINEAHGLKPNAVLFLLDMLERLRPYCVVIFTTTNDGQTQLLEDHMDAAPLLSRCKIFQLNSHGEELALAFALHCRKLAQAESLDGKPIADYVQLVRKHNYNLRACLNAIESCEML